MKREAAITQRPRLHVPTGYYRKSDNRIDGPWFAIDSA